MTLTAALAAFTTGLRMGAMPPEVEEKARTCLLNGIGIALGSHTTPFAPVARTAALAMDGGRADATFLCDGRHAGIAGAALANAALFHGRAQEDTCGAAHIGAIVIPLLTALAEARSYPLDRFLPAMVAGYEVGGLLESALGVHTTPAGLRASPLYGTLAAAAAAARMMELDADRTAAALANAAAFAGGTLQSFADATDEWRYQVGMAACNGLAAAELAAAGSVSAPHALEGPSGFIRAFARVEIDTDALAARLGRDWSIHRVAFKPYPVCAFNQTPVIAALALKERIGGRTIASIRVAMNPYEAGYAGMDSVGPFHSLSGTLMSIPFCIAATLLRGIPSIHTMADYDDAEIGKLIGRITLVSDDAVPRLSCRIEAILEDGQAVTQYEKKTADDFSYDRANVLTRVRAIGDEMGVVPSAYARLADFVEGLPKGGIGELVDLCALVAEHGDTV